jgi:tRNA threonylcarbamoyladenosine biosynthesis protein TsaB
VRRTGFLAELAWQRFQAGEIDDMATLEPIYLGQPVKSV